MLISQYHTLYYYLLVLGIGGAAKLGTTVTVCLWRSTTTSYAARSPLSTRGTLISRWGTLFLPGLAKTWWHDNRWICSPTSSKPLQQPQLSSWPGVSPTEEALHSLLPPAGSLQANPSKTSTGQGRSAHVPAIRSHQRWHSAWLLASRKHKVPCERVVYGGHYPEAFLPKSVTFSSSVSSHSEDLLTTSAPGLPLHIQCNNKLAKQVDAIPGKATCSAQLSNAGALEMLSHLKLPK